MLTKTPASLSDSEAALLEEDAKPCRDGLMSQSRCRRCRNFGCGAHRPHTSNVNGIPVHVCPYCYHKGNKSGKPHSMDRLIRETIRAELASNASSHRRLAGEAEEAFTQYTIARDTHELNKKYKGFSKRSKKWEISSRKVAALRTRWLAANAKLGSLMTRTDRTVAPTEQNIGPPPKGKPILKALPPKKTRHSRSSSRGAAM